MEVHLRDLFSRFQEQFGAGPGLGPTSGTCLLRPDGGGAPPSLIRSLSRAAAALSRTDPWKRLRPHHLLGVRVGRDADWPSSRRQPFPCAQFVGGDGGDLALHLFRSDQDALRATAPRQTLRPPNVELLRVLFLPEALLSSANRRMVRSLSLESDSSGRFPVVDIARFATSGGVRFRNPTLEELRFLYAFMRAAALVHPLLTAADEAAPRRGRPLAFDHFIETVDVEWPPEVSPRGSDLVAVTISHPPGEAYDDRKPGHSPTRYAEPPTPPSEEFAPSEMDAKAAQRSAAMRQCAVCEKDVHSEQSLSCGRCRAVVYCGASCQKQHWKESHRGICGLYKAMMEREEELAIKIFVFPCFVEHPCKWLDSVGVHQKGMWRRKCSCYAHCPYGLLPTRQGGHSESWGGLNDRDYPPNSAFPNYRDGTPSPLLLSGWSEYYALRSLPMSSPVAAILSHPLTVYHIMTSLAMNSKSCLAKGREVVVHYLGPEGELDWMPAFMEIGHLLNGSGNVQMFMIGPEVPSNLLGTASGMSGGRVKVNLVRGVYQEEASSLPVPNVVLALNCGLESFGSWGGALELIKSLDVPAFFTDRSEVACANAKQVLRGAGLHITHPVAPNPFRSPVRDRMPSSNLPSFSNGFVFGVNT